MADLDNLTSLTTLLAGLSVASERLVEIIKNSISWLNVEKPDATTEGRRRAALQALAVGAGVATTFLASHIEAVKEVTTGKPAGIIVIGLLASGGSGLWNSVQSYLGNVKNIKKAEVENKKADTQVKEKLVTQGALQTQGLSIVVGK